MHFVFFTGTLIVLALSGCGQKAPESKNIFSGAEHLPSYQGLFSKLDSLEEGEQTSITIVHIGDSHLQAGYLSEKIKAQLYRHYAPTDSILSPGLVFPYSLAHTNNPYYYESKGAGRWQGYRNVQKHLPVPLGVSGISLQTDTLSRITISFRNTSRTNRYAFNQISVLGRGEALLETNTPNPISFKPGELLKLDMPFDSIELTVTPSSKEPFVLQGVVMDYTPAPIRYHTIGINGAQAKSYLQCNDLHQQLKNLSPDWVIVSLGTNEAYSQTFDVDTIQHAMESFIELIDQVTPQAAKLLCTPNDHLNRYQHPNPNVEPLIGMQKEMAEKHGWALWDFYQLMGGKGSINHWAKDSLTARDKIHFNRKGYERQGELFFDALLQTKANWEDKW